MQIFDRSVFYRSQVISLKFCLFVLVQQMSLPGNTDAETNNIFWFKFTLDARYIRVIPDPYEGGTHGGGGKPCFRFDLFGCYNGKDQCATFSVLVLFDATQASNECSFNKKF